MVWGGVSLEGHTDLHVLANGTLIAVRVCRQFLDDEGIDAIDWPSRFPDLSPIENLWDVIYRCIRCRQVAPETVQVLTDALIQVWEEIPQDTIRCLIRSLITAQRLEKIQSEVQLLFCMATALILHQRTGVRRSKHCDGHVFRLAERTRHCCTIFAKIFKTPVTPVAPASDTVSHGSPAGAPDISVSAREMPLTSSVSSVSVKPPGLPSLSSGLSRSVQSSTFSFISATGAQTAGLTAGAGLIQIPVQTHIGQSYNSVLLNSSKLHQRVSSGLTPAKASSKAGALRTQDTVDREPDRNVACPPALPFLSPPVRQLYNNCWKTGEANRDLGLIIIGKKLSKETAAHSYSEKNLCSLPADFTKSIVGVIESYHSNSTSPRSSSGQSTPTTNLNNSWSGIQSYATGLSTERSSVYSWRHDEFDRINTQKVRQLFWEIDEMLYEGKVSHRTQGLQGECEEWNKHSTKLRILGSQLTSPKDEGFQHYQQRDTLNGNVLLPLCQDSADDLKELSVVGEKLVPVPSPLHSTSNCSHNSSDSTLFSFLEEEIYEAEGQIEEFLAYDFKEMEEEGLEFRKTSTKIKSGVPPVSPQSCIKDTVMAELFDDVWRDVVHVLEEPIQKHWENDLPEEGARIVNTEDSGKLLAEPASHCTVKVFSVPPSRGSETRSMSFWPTQVSHIPSAFKSNLNGVMTIQAKPLQHRHHGLGEKIQCEQEEKPSPSGGQSRLVEHSILSSSRVLCTISRRPPPNSRLPKLSTEPARSKNHSVYSNEVLRGTKLYTVTESLTSSPVCSAQNKKFPPIISEVPEKGLSIPVSRHLQRRGRYLSSRVSSAVHGSTCQRPLREMPLLLEPLARPSTTHTFRSDTPFKRSFTPVDFACHSRVGRGTFTGNHTHIGVTGIGVGISCSTASSFSEYTAQQKRQFSNHSVLEGEEGEYQPSWGLHHQPRAFIRHPANTKKRFQLVSS
ncbi:protein FAM149A [Amia ocellicauda]|uniref:protein FAM149A n=1 Tax=Amia ocellicauda TaxID=2972642 RepID=UPI0034641535